MLSRRTDPVPGARAPAFGPSRLAALIIAVLVAGIAVPVMAETPRLLDSPASKFQMAPGGVDMRTGRYVYNETDISIGGDGGLTLSRTMTQVVPGHDNPFANFSHNWDIMIEEERVDLDSPRLQGDDFRIYVQFGGRSQTFESRYIDTGYTYRPDGPRRSLTYTGGTRQSTTVVYTYGAADGSVAVFRPLAGGGCTAARCAYVDHIVEADGTRYDFAYVSSGGSGGGERLQSVVSSRGYALFFQGSGNLVTKACVLNLAVTVLPTDGLCPGGAQAAATYGYTSSGPSRLASVTGPDSAVSGFTYPTSTTMGFVRPGETTPWLVNTLYQHVDERNMTQDIVGSQSFADGQSYTYSFVLGPPPGYARPGAYAGGTYQNAAGERTDVFYDWPIMHGYNAPGSPCTHLPCTPPEYIDEDTIVPYQLTPGPVLITDPRLRNTTFDYCDPVVAAGLPPSEHNRCSVISLQSFTDPEGFKTDLQYDAARNITRVTRHPRPGSPPGTPDIVTSATYDTAHSIIATKPLSMTDANGNTTDYTYSLTHGGLLTETGPAPATAAPRPQTRHSYEERFAWVSNGSGGYTRVATGIYLLTSSSMCRTSAPGTSTPCATAGDEVRTDYEYGPDSGPNTLLLRGQTVTSTDGGVTTTLRTCYTYDALGRKISETRPNGTVGVTSCP